MANPMVEKLKTLGLRHGEKAAVGLAVTLFLLFVFMAITKKTIEMKPEELAENAKSADSNLSKSQAEGDILAFLERNGVKPGSEFEQTVDKQQSKALNPADYLVKNKWVTPEPGAGLIRDQPELIAVNDLYVFPNRGGYLVYDLDSKGNKIPDTGTDGPKKKQRLGKSRPNRGGMMGGMMSGSGSGMMGGMGRTSAKQKQQDEEARKAEEIALKKSLVGDVVEKPDATKKAADAAPVATAQVTYKEKVKGYRSVVVTGTLDNKKLRENYLAALKDPSLAYPNYKRLDVQRQMLLPNGRWTPFANVDSNFNVRVLDNLPEVDDELVPEAPGPRLEALVDPLPFAKSGAWNSVHIASLVPKDKREIAKPPDGAGGVGGFGGNKMMGSFMGGDSARGSSSSGGGKFGGNMMMGGSGGGGTGMASEGGGMSRGMPGGSAMGGGYPGMGGGYPGMGGGAAASTGPADETDFQKSESDEVMIRSIDFTVQPDTTYRYQVRVVVVNPNYLRSDVSPGTETDADELKGPWSAASSDVTVPADVAAYAMTKTPPGRTRKDQVTFQVVRWNPEDGHTVLRNDEAGPGELIGNPASTEIPSTDGTGKKNQLVDFNSHRFVLDSMGGTESLRSSLKAGPTFDVPALSLVVRIDGSVAVHGQSRDAIDDVRVEMEKGYRQDLKDSSKRREPMGMGGMMGSGGMMGGGGR